MKKKRSPWMPFPSCETGAGLVETIMALGLLAATAVLVTNKHTQVQRAKKHVELRADIATLKKTLLISTNCAAIPACQGQELRALVDYDSKTLVAADGQSRFRDWTVQARCTNNKTLEVRVALLDAAGKPLQEPLKGTLMDWQAPEGILIESGILCGPLNPSTPQGTLKAEYGPRCLANQGSCYHPYHPGEKICCLDGRDAAKPTCSGNSREIAVYWDRQGDWGASGQWVALCQK